MNVVISNRDNDDAADSQSDGVVAELNSLSSPPDKKTEVTGGPCTMLGTALVCNVFAVVLARLH
jgi:hypothetical protein